MSVPPSLIPKLLGFDLPQVESAMLIPFPSPAGGFMEHVRMKIFPTILGRKGNTVKYLQPKASGVRLFFPMATLKDALFGSGPLYLVEGEKKALAVAQLGIAAVGFCGIEGWHRSRTMDLLPDFHFISLRGRIVEILPDGDWRTNSLVRRGAEKLAIALKDQGAAPRMVVLPEAI